MEEEIKKLREDYEKLSKHFIVLQGKFVKLCELNLKLVEQVDNLQNVIIRFTKDDVEKPNNESAE